DPWTSIFRRGESKMTRKALLFLWAATGLAACQDADKQREHAAETKTPLAATTPAAPKAQSTAWIIMKHQADLSGAKAIKNWKERGQFVYDQLTRAAQSSQVSAMSTLSSRGVRYQPYWIVNAIRVTADASTLAAISRDPSVEKIISEET